MNKIVKQIKPKLKPCPFCGGQASVLTRGEITFFARCSKCYATIDGFFKTEEMAIESWNRRVRRCRKGN